MQPRKLTIPATLIAVCAIVWLAFDRSGASSQQPGPPAFDTVSNRILASDGVELEREPASPQSSPANAPADAIKEALRQMSLPSEFAEPPRLVRFKTPIPGIDATDGRPFWPVSLSGNIQFAGGPRGFTPHPQSKGSYAVAFLSNDKGKVQLEYA